MRDFVYTALPSRVLFGRNSLDRLPEEVAAAGVRQALVLSTPGQRGLAEDIARRLGPRATGVFDGAVMHVPVATVREAAAAMRSSGADGCVAVGGGSTIGLGKAIALEHGLPVVAVPTTYAGSEMTSIWGLTEGGTKRTGRDPKVLPRTVIYDPALTVSLPPRIAGPSGMNAIAHCVEALYAEDANPIVSLMAAEGIRALARSLPVIVKEPENLEARSDAQYGAWLAGASLGAVGMSLHHKLCHTLGGSFNLPHAETHAVVLPHAAAYNRDAAADTMTIIAEALGTKDAPAGLFDLATRVGAKTALRDIGMQQGDLDRAAALASTNPYYNPRPITQAGIRDLLDAAYDGRRPDPPC